MTFTLAELWLLHDLVRHEVPQRDQWKYPPADLALNDDIAAAIYACETDKLPEYTLDLERGDLLVIDYCLRRDVKTPEGANGKVMLLKTFRTRAELGGLKVGNGIDLTYKEVKHHASGSTDDRSDEDPGAAAG